MFKYTNNDRFWNHVGNSVTYLHKSIQNLIYTIIITPFFPEQCTHIWGKDSYFLFDPVLKKSNFRIIIITTTAYYFSDHRLTMHKCHSGILLEYYPVLCCCSKQQLQLQFSEERQNIYNHQDMTSQQLLLLLETPFCALSLQR